MFCCEIDSEIDEHIHVMEKGRFNVDSEILGEVSKENESGIIQFYIILHFFGDNSLHWLIKDFANCESPSFYFSMSCYILRVLDDRF